mmetsp:Transcript_46529/g.110190  ORF Transcript_46529/g.110190 Transcript_46529/m.110190 type:complete len:244 (-) Transcript_46529:10-741(-)|eukprot:CAMPEP_0177733476 /NCGR_PEP_ID=MMETSP0484_2-20121128/23702_1 /TAXON_ID=354590 /ORGANISM="Rhodomonas lens, Strain RHODO" /LENGTH=243 /DNA_ID=CAMNT_0019246853 /DNA_START=60 /DNA_END=791 /DNA_ORIENTATION=-
MQSGRTDVDTSSDEAVARFLQQQEGSISYQHTISIPPQQARPGTAPPSRPAAAAAPAHAGPSADMLLAQRLQEEENQLRSGRAPQPPPTQRPTDSDMLYVPAKLAGRPVDLFVDTGAQSSVISEGIVNQLGLANRMNRMVWGTVHGVGTASVVGQLSGIPVEVGSSGVEFAMSFLVLNTTQPLLILGLDQMRKFKVLVDLDRQELTFGGHGGIPVPFIPSSRTQTQHLPRDMLGLAPGECGVM